MYAQLYKTYADTRDLKQAAKDAGVTLAVAKKYINEGTEHLPAISERVTALDKRTVGQLEAEILQSRHDTIDIVSKVSRKLAESLDSVEIVLSSSRLFDEEGIERLAENGKPLIPVDANGLRTVLQAARDITELLGTLTGSKTPQTSQNNAPTVNVGVVLSPDGVREAAGKVMKSAISDPASLQGAVLEGQFREIVVGEATRRVEEADEA